MDSVFKAKLKIKIESNWLFKTHMQSKCYLFWSFNRLLLLFQIEAIDIEKNYEMEDVKMENLAVERIQNVLE